jgi:hypothetical protein
MEKKTILVVVILLTAITTAFAQTAADFSVELTADGSGVRIRKYEGRGLAVTVPNTIEGLPVREIGEYAFDGGSSTQITSITLPQGLNKIMKNAFSFQLNLAAIVIPDSVTEIGDSAFRGCTALKSINIPGSVTFFGSSIFYQSGIERFTLGEGFTVIPESIFAQCKLISVIIPEGVTEIKNSAFNGNRTLTSVTLPSTIKKIGNGAFNACNELITFSIPDSVEAIEFDNYAFGYNAKLNLASQSAIKRRGYTGSF